MQDAGIVRNRAKIEATAALARIVSRLHGKRRLRPPFVELRRRASDRECAAEYGGLPAESEVSRAIAKDLRARGGNFVGPTIIYAFMQATGMVNDHLVGCCRHEACRALAREFRP